MNGYNTALKAIPSVAGTLLRYAPKNPLARRLACVKSLIFIFSTFIIPPIKADEWMWIKTINNVASGWQSETGFAKVTIDGDAFKAVLFWGPDKTLEQRIILVGSIKNGKIVATETVLDTDLEPSEYNGSYMKQIWRESFGGVLGTEAITLSDGFNMIGLRRNIVK